MWSHTLRCWIYLVPQLTGQNPPGTLELTPEHIDVLKAWLEAGWQLEDAIPRAFGLVVPVPHV